jgi:hypothetical protein
MQSAFPGLEAIAIVNTATKDYYNIQLYIYAVI